MKLLQDYEVKRQEIFDYFGYVEDYVVIPLDDSTDYYWKLNQSENGSGEVYYADSQEEVDDDDATYCDEIYTQRFLPKWVYRGEAYTMICCNPGVDGNKFLRIFDNAKEQK